MSRLPRPPRFLEQRAGRVGVALLLPVLAVALIAPLLAGFSPDAAIGLPGTGPGIEVWEKSGAVQNATSAAATWTRRSGRSRFFTSSTSSPPT